MELIGWAVIHSTVGKVKVRPRILGKIATVLQMICLIWLMLQWDMEFNSTWYWTWTLGAAFCTGISGLLYVWDGMKQLSSHPHSSASPDTEP